MYAFKIKNKQQKLANFCIWKEKELNHALMYSYYNILSYLTLQQYIPYTNYSLNNPSVVNIDFEKSRPFN